ncbi:MAG TPA: response regulator [Anaerolineales bacterium]|nr:response regulator [Anaerolineales bacterium]HMR98726.1 response regulator [Anaerolineales bacterium]HNQ96049.1 response regulator [Anaerolineales bacterium]HNS60219.1 response regulator [Anaerolineales bacterium]
MTSPTVLYIEDHPDNMTLVRRILQSESYTLIEAKTGLQGIFFAETEDVDLILLDINLPDIDGYEVARRLRVSKKNRLAEIPIIAVTANAMKGDHQRILDSGCNFYIAKPINIQELLDKVEGLISEGSMRLR